MQMLQALLARVHLSPAPNAARLDDGMDYIQIHHPEIAGKYAHLFDAADGTILPQDKADAAALGKVLDHLPDFRKMMEELAIAEGRLPGDIEVRATGTHGGGTWGDITASSASSGSSGGNGGNGGSGNNIPGNTSRGSLLGDGDGKSGGDGGNDFLSKKENEENTGPKPENPLDGDDGETGKKPDDGPDDKINDIDIPEGAKIVKNTVKRRRAEDIPAVLHPTADQQKTAKELGVDPRWIKPDGKIDWPDDDGFGAISWRMTLEPGTRFDRYGGRIDPVTGRFVDTGSYVSPPHVPFPERALPANSKDGYYIEYEIVRPIPNARVGAATPWFDQPGGGLQYELPMGIDTLVLEGYIRKVKVKNVGKH